MIGLTVEQSRIIATRLSSIADGFVVEQVHQVALDRPVGFSHPDFEMLGASLDQALAQVTTGSEEEMVALLSDSLVLLADLDASNTAASQGLLYAAEEQFPVDLELLDTAMLPEADGRVLVAACPAWLLDAISQAAAKHRLSITGFSSQLFALLAGRSSHNDVTILAEADGPSCWIARGCASSVLAVRSLTIQDHSSLPDWQHFLTQDGPETAEDTLERHEPSRIHICAPPELAKRWAESLRSGDPQLDISTLQPSEPHDERIGPSKSSTHLLSPLTAAAQALKQDGLVPLRFRTQSLRRVRRSRLLGRPLQIAGWLFAVALLLGSACLYQDAHQAKRRSTTARQEQTAVYHRLFGDDAALPPDVLLRLQSERTRLTGLSGRAAGRPVYRSALESLRELTIVLPKHLRFNLDRIHIGQNDLAISGAALSHSGAQKIQQSVASSKHFAARAPRTKRLDSGGVSFAISATCEGNKR